MIMKNNKEVGFIYKKILPDLPSAYQRIAYIECTGSTAYFDTGVTPNQDTKIDLEIYTYDTLGTAFWYGCRESATALASIQALYYLRTTGDGERFAYGTSNLYRTLNQTLPLRRHIVQDKNKLYLDGTLVNTWEYSTWTAPCSMAIGSLFSTSSKTLYTNGTTTRARFYYFKIWDNGTLVRDYVPCYRKYDNVAGMYDLVNNVFYENQGTGIFIKGGEITGNIDMVLHNGDIVFEQGFTREASGIVPLSTPTASVGKDLKNYIIYGNSVQSKLPSEYQEVEYISSSGSQYIDTGLEGKSGYTFETKVSFNSFPNTYSYISGFGNSSSNRIYFTRCAKSSMTDGYTYSSNATNLSNYSVSANTIYEYKSIMKVGEQKYYRDGVLIGSASSTNTVSYGNIWLFTADYINNPNGSVDAKIYYARYSYDGEIVRDFVPCYRKSDNAIGMYDLVEGKFYENKGSGTFTMGNNVTSLPTPTKPIEIESVGDNETELPLGYTEVEYLQSSGTQYINTNIYFDFSKNFRVVGKVINPDTTTRKIILSSYISDNTNYASNSFEFGGTSNSQPGKFRTYFQKVGYTTTSIWSTSALPQDTLLEYNTFYSVTDGKCYTTINYGTDSLSYSGTVTSNTDVATNPLRFFLDYRSGASAIANPVKIGRTKIYKDDKLVGNFIPAKNSSNVLGMYDTVTKTFYTNNGTGTFTAGNEVAEGGYKIPVTVRGKNIVDRQQAKIQGIKDETPFAAWASQAFNNEWVTNNLKPNTTYSVSFDVECISVPDYDTKNSAYVGMTLYSGISGYSTVTFYTSQYLTAGEKIRIERTITTPSGLLDAGANYRILTYTNRYLKNSAGVSSTMRFTNIQIEENPSVTAYEKYQSPITTNIYLDEPLRKIGDYADYIDFEQQKMYKKIGKTTFVGTENWIVTVHPTTGKTRTYTTKIRDLCNKENELFCEIYRKEAPNSYPNLNACDIASNGTFIAGVDGTQFETSQDYKDWVAANNYSVYYQLATPTEESVTLPTIPSLKGTTIYSIGTQIQPSSMYIKYKGR